MAITDSFTGADGTGIVAYSANWAYVRGTGTNLEIRSNGFAAEAGGNTDYFAVRTEASFPATHSSQVRLAAIGSAAATGCAVRCQAPASGDGYGHYSSAEGTDLFELDNGVYTLLTAAASYAANDVISLEASGTTLTPKKNGSTTGAPAATTDATHTGGKPGICAFSNSGGSGVTRCDDFSATDAEGGAQPFVTPYLNSRANRPGRGPYSKGAKRRPRVDVYPVAAISADADGQTVSAAVSLLDGEASADSSAAGETLTATASLIDGTGSNESTANGATLTVTASLIDGVAGTDHTAEGETLTATASLIDGSASGSDTAEGETLSVTTSLIDGAASANNAIDIGTYLGSRANRPGRGPYSLGRYYRRRDETFTPTGDAQAGSVSLTATASLIAGTAQAASQADGQALAVTASLIAGAASSSVSVGAETLLLTASLIAGGVAADSEGAGTVLAIAASLMDGAATGNQAGQADGEVLVVAAQLLTGLAIGDEATGATLQRRHWMLRRGR